MLRTNWQSIAAPYVGFVNPILPVTIVPNFGYRTLSDGARVPTYGTPITGWRAQIQALTYQDLRQVDGLNISGVRRAIYLSGRWPGVVRPFQRGGDLITFPSGVVYLSAHLLEDWNDTSGWCKVVATLQNAPIERIAAGETFVEIGTDPFYQLADGTIYGQQVVIVDNLLRASVAAPIVIYGNFNSGPTFSFTVPGQAVEPFWDGSQWVLG